MTGTDISANALVMAKEQVRDATFIQNAMEYLPFEDYSKAYLHLDPN